METPFSGLNYLHLCFNSPGEFSLDFTYDSSFWGHLNYMGSNKNNNKSGKYFIPGTGFGLGEKIEDKDLSPVTGTSAAKSPPTTAGVVGKLQGSSCIGSGFSFNI